MFFKVIDQGVSEKLRRPAALAMDGQDKLYVLDTGRNSVTVYSPAGEALREFGNDPARESEKLGSPVALLATQEELFVLDADRVRVYSFEGRLLRSFAAPGKDKGELAEADAMALRDASSFFIAERGSARVQLFATQYKPRAPQQLVAQPAVHGVVLRWAASPLAYVSQYLVYRAVSEAGPFVRIGSSKTAQYADANLSARGKILLPRLLRDRAGSGRPGWCSRGGRGLEVHPAAAGRSQGRSHHLARAADLEGAGYADGDRLSGLPEGRRRLQPSWPNHRARVRAREPESRHPLYLLPGRTQRRRRRVGAESVQVSTQADTRAPLEIDVSELNNVFSNTYKLYEREGVGTIKLSNNTRVAMNEVKVSFVLNNFMDFPTETQASMPWRRGRAARSPSRPCSTTTS